MNLRTRAMVIGGVLGAIIGILAGMLYFNTNVKYDQDGLEQLASPTSGDSLKLGLSLLGLLRMFTE
ncbi:MAG: hypothetical protein JXA33_09560 [Anaerolineae bacterium]|nr:hypothetical protein [Anaerolineae bacterium]